MSIICSKYITNNIGIDIGDGLITTILYHDTTIPSSNTITLIVPEINNNNNITIYYGNNILASDNMMLQSIMVKSPEKIIYINFTISIMSSYMNQMCINVMTKTILLMREYINIPCYKIALLEKTIDTYNYKIKFELKQYIDIIISNINNNNIKMLEEDKPPILKKLDQIINMMDQLSNQKLLDLKTNLKNKFLI